MIPVKQHEHMVPRADGAAFARWSLSMSLRSSTKPASALMLARQASAPGRDAARLEIALALRSDLVMHGEERQARAAATTSRKMMISVGIARRRIGSAASSRP
jgi:hypothetical protein